MYEVTGSEEGVATLTRVITEHKETIQCTTRGPLFEKTPNIELEGLIDKDKQKVRSTMCSIGNYLYSGKINEF